MKNYRFLHGKRGLTLVEIIVSLAVLALLSLFVVSVFSITISIIGQQSVLKRANNDAAAGIENHFGGFEPDSGICAVEQQRDSLSIDFGGLIVEEDGVLVKGADDDNTAVFFYFTPDR